MDIDVPAPWMHRAEESPWELQVRLLQSSKGLVVDRGVHQHRNWPWYQSYPSYEPSFVAALAAWSGPGGERPVHTCAVVAVAEYRIAVAAS